MPILLPERSVRRHAITTYDFEWRKGEFEGDHAELDFLLAGAFDERGYRPYSSLEDFVCGELVTRNCGRRFYAHFGGASDMVFLLRVLARRKHWAIKALFSGSSAIVVRVEDGKRHWTFLDSFWTMRVGLATIGEWLGLPKGTIDHSVDHTPAEWLEYNERDCRILYDALLGFQEIVNDRGCELRVTGASTALDMIRRRYLVRPINNLERINEYVRPAYVSSKVQPYWKHCRNAMVYDINSSFPYSMTFPLPGDLLSTDGSIPDNGEGLWCADVDVIVPEQYNPPLPWRHPEEGRVFFPTGTFRTRITSEDLKCGDFCIDKVHSCWRFEERLDLQGFAEDLFALRKGGGFQGQVWKIIVNSGYGKFAERAEKEVLYVNPKQTHPSMRAIAPHIYMGTEVAEIEHAHVPFSAFTTARSRRFLREHENNALHQPGGELYYSDTDSVMVNVVLPTSAALGGLKEEARIVEGLFEGAKLYAYIKENGAEVAKAKGFSRTVNEGGVEQRLRFEDVVALQDGHVLTVERMRRLKEQISDAGGFDYVPDVVKMQKQLRFPRGKRSFFDDGSSRPWEVAELLEEAA